MRNVPFAFIVLGISALLEAIGTISSLHAFRTYTNEKGGENLSFIEAIKENRNQFTLTILFEHGVSLAGIVVAFFAVFFSEILRKPVLDPIGSIIIAFMLSAIAVFLIAESRALLIGERTMKHMLENVNKIASEDPNIERVENIRTMHFGPEEALLSLNSRLGPDLGSEELGETIRDLRKRIQKENPEFKNILIDSDSLALQAEGKKS